MNTLATFFASIIALFSGLLGQTQSPPLIQDVSNKVITTESSSSTLEKISSVANISTSTETVSKKENCIYVLVKLRKYENYEYKKYSQCGNVLGDYQSSSQVLFTVRNRTDEDTELEPEVTQVTTPLGSSLLSEHSQVLKYTLSKIDNDCTSVHVDYKNNKKEDGIYCGYLPYNHFIVNKKLYYGSTPNKDLGSKAFFVAELGTTTEIIDYSSEDGFDTDNLFIGINNKVLLNGKELAGADPKTFQTVSHNLRFFTRTHYSKDKTKVFFRDVPILGADPSTFGSTLSDGGTHIYYSRDKNHVYFGGEIIKNADPSTFVSLYITPYEGPDSDVYGKDSKRVYYATTTVFKADVSSFGRLDWCSFADKNYVFGGGQIVPNVDPKTYKCPVYEYACLAKGTKILMSDGGYKNIENIIVGDMVMSLNIGTKKQTPSRVVKTIKRKDPLVIINDILKAAPDEPLYLSDGSIKEAQSIKIGDLLVNEKGLSVKVFAIEESKQVVDTYDLLLSNHENFFADGFLVRTPEKW